ncbi:MAG: enoyl-CoA hydratase/isomerase family protein [Chloroflexota bacterium]
MITDPPVLVDAGGPVARLTLNRPSRRNALDGELAPALVSAIQEASAHSSTRVIILTGAGSAFCAGADLAGLARDAATGDSGLTGSHFARVEPVYRALIGTPQPTIAMINGFALAGGCGIATACDIAIASESAELGYPEVHLGLAPAMVMVLLFRLVGFRAGLELALSGRRIPASEAATLGLINRAVPSGELEPTVLRTAEALLGHSGTALATIKRAAWSLPDLDISRGLSAARDLSTLCALSPEAVTGMQAFLARSNH